jgi:hypothetical protein
MSAIVKQPPITEQEAYCNGWHNGQVEILNCLKGSLLHGISGAVPHMPVNGGLGRPLTEDEARALWEAIDCAVRLHRVERRPELSFERTGRTRLELNWTAPNIDGEGHEVHDLPEPRKLIEGPPA